MARHTFLEKIQAASAAAKSGEASEATAADLDEKPASPETMTDHELEAAITTARRDLLDAQHSELRERELVSRVAKAPEAPRASGLAEVLGGLQKHKRRTWR